ncbi:hypothetical protein GCM10022225_53020 [Plantactinospora mayteni]|uniref:Uncharacterized protein n=1 Tax=Plantactinospora mayteni TaxID=566021 RepID=A0ABQ4EYP1_9ACTN|nr:hypothetical protein Pma05_63540 [Plantactinospora mayteni]
MAYPATPVSHGPGGRPADPPAPVPLVVPAPALPSWPPPTNPMSSANQASGGTPGYSLPTADPGPSVAAEPAGRPWPGDRPPGTSPASPHLQGTGPASPHHQGTAPTTPHSPGYRDRDLARDQRAEGTVYGGPEGHLTVSMPSNQLENSGSLTGHILAQGWTDTPTQKTNTGKVVLVLLIGLGILVAVGVLVVFLVGDVFSSLFDGLLSS